MSRYIEADKVLKELHLNHKDVIYIDKRDTAKRIEKIPSIDIVRCKECKWSKANGTYQWCGRLDSTARITADDFCSYGEREGE